ncbi:MAG: T9SS type A sorting domain-containing protein [Bacteroidia bacterium]
MYDIAVQSPITGGRAVYWARVLLELEVDDFYDESGGRFGEPKQVSLSGKVKNRGKFYPNPASAKANYEIYLNADEQGTFDIFNALGEKLKSCKLKEGFNKLEIDANKINNGLLFYNLTTTSNYNEKGKFVVNK